ncbi:MAG: DUF6268 family outer membrane beta-barrel protein [Cyclobacteriaceae bacterium]
MKKLYLSLSVAFFFWLPFAVLAQEDDEFDFSSLVPAEQVKAFCTSRILNGGPQNLFSIGYDIQGAYDMEVGEFLSNDAQRVRVNSTSEFRIDIQYPVISKNNITVGLQLNYLDTHYNFEDGTSLQHPLLRTLDQNGLTSTSFSTVIFKPLSMSNFMLFQAGATLNGDYTFSDFQSLSYTRFFGAVIYGWKPSERKMWGLGVSRTYLGGALNYLPVFYYQYSTADGRWGIDALLPSRFNMKRNFSKQSILSLGFNFQGNTYRLNELVTENGNEMLEPELRRSELRFRAIFDQAITPNLWFSVQGGLRYNWEYNVDDGEFFRSLFSEDPYLFENSIGNPLFAQFSISWVSP